MSQSQMLITIRKRHTKSGNDVGPASKLTPHQIEAIYADGSTRGLASGFPPGFRSWARAAQPGDSVTYVKKRSGLMVEAWAEIPREEEV